MLFNRPKNLKYTTMSIYIDEHIYTNDCDDALVFEYLYHIVNMLAFKNKFFSTAEYYENFAIYCATNYFLRLKNKKQFELNEDGTPKMSKIKSILNFIKKTINFRRMAFQQEFFCQSISKDEVDLDIGYTFANKLSESIDALSVVEFTSCLGDICKTAKKFIEKVPHKKDSAEWDNIYLSCILTFLNQITLNNKDEIKVQNLHCKSSDKLNIISNVYLSNSVDSVILYHLPENMKDYIMILTNEMKHAISKDLSFQLHTYVPTDTSFGLSYSIINSEDCSNET